MQPALDAPRGCTGCWLVFVRIGGGDWRQPVVCTGKRDDTSRGYHRHTPPPPSRTTRALVEFESFSWTPLTRRVPAPASPPCSLAHLALALLSAPSTPLKPSTSSSCWHATASGSSPRCSARSAPADSKLSRASAPGVFAASGLGCCLGTRQGAGGGSRAGGEFGSFGGEWFHTHTTHRLSVCASRWADAT